MGDGVEMDGGSDGYGEAYWAQAADERREARAKVMRIRIHASRCEWGMEVTEDEDVTLHDRYTDAAVELLQKRYPYADVDIEVDRKTSGGRTRITVHVDDGGIDHLLESDARAADIEELLGAAWQRTLEGS